MGILFTVWHQLVEHSWEILWALVFGLFFELVSPRSRLKTLIRIIANQLSVVSVK